MAKSQRTAASYVAEERNKKPLSSAMFTWAKTNMSKLKNPTAAQKKIFAKYKAMVKAGDNPANPKPKPKPAKPVASKPAATKPASSKANTGTGRDGKFGTGTYGQGRPSDSKTTPKSKPVSETERRRRARRSNRGGARNATVNAMDAFKSAVKFVDTKLRLTHKKGDVKKVGNKTYRWDGKKWQLLNRPF